MYLKTCITSIGFVTNHIFKLFWNLNVPKIETWAKALDHHHVHLLHLQVKRNIQTTNHLQIFQFMSHECTLRFQSAKTRNKNLGDLEDHHDVHLLHLEFTITSLSQTICKCYDS